VRLVGACLFVCLILPAAFSQSTVTKAAQTAKVRPSASASPAEKKKSPASESKIEGPITTEIYANEAFFDSNKNIGIFTGHVRVLDPRFSLQSDKLTVFLHRGEEQGLDKAIAEGNVGVVRDRVNPDTGQPEHAVGRSDKAVYTSADGNVELAGTPRVQQGVNMHVATEPDTVMILNQDGQLTTHGPSRTEIRQEAQDAKAALQPKQ
jgi:lipopolysaccharide transport protein LptA